MRPEHTAELQGAVSRPERERLWRERRVFFCTPQAMDNDLKAGACAPESFVCVVIDEAHKATGNFAYVSVVREIAARSRRFRVLALSATPGTDVRKVQEVLRNLRVHKVEARATTTPRCEAHARAHARGHPLRAERRGARPARARVRARAAVRRPARGGVLRTKSSPSSADGLTHARGRCASAAARPATSTGTSARATSRSRSASSARSPRCATGASARCARSSTASTARTSRRSLAGRRRSASARPVRATARGRVRPVARAPQARQAARDPARALRARGRGGAARQGGAAAAPARPRARRRGRKSTTRAIVFSNLRSSVKEIVRALKAEPQLRAARAFVGQGGAGGGARRRAPRGGRRGSARRRPFAVRRSSGAGPTTPAERRR